MNLDLEKLSKEEIVQLFLAEQKRANEKEITIEESNSKITDLKRQNDNLLRMLYGSRRERFEKVDPNQMKISFEEYASEEGCLLNMHYYNLLCLMLKEKNRIHYLY